MLCALGGTEKTIHTPWVLKWELVSSGDVTLSSRFTSTTLAFAESYPVLLRIKPNEQFCIVVLGPVPIGDPFVTPH